MKNNTIDLLVIQPLMNELASALSSRFICHHLYEHKDMESYLQLHGEKIRAVVTRGDVGINMEIMSRLPNLEIISVFGVGTDRIDLEETARRNIIVTITSGTLTDDVADLAFAFILATSRQLISMDRFSRTSQWLTSQPQLSSKVSGKKIGIVGLGSIGKAIARRAVAFDMIVGYCNRQDADIDGYQYYPTIKELALFCDFLVLSLPGSEENKGIIDKGVLLHLGEEGILVNVARGSLVNEADLIESLTKRKIKGAALDVYCDEPDIPEAFFSLDNVLLTPHIASATWETRNDMAKNVYNNLDRYFSSGVPVTPIILS